MTSPKLRFKEFGGCWENTSFQSLFTFKNGINASKEQYGSGTKFINVLDIINNPNGITYDSIIGSVQVFQKDIDKNLVNYGDVVFQRSSETREEVGQSNVYLSKEPVVFGGFVIRGSARVPYDPLFMNGLLKTDKVRDQITQLSGGSTRFNIGQDSLNKVSVFLPSKEEQTKIASFLSNVDDKISQLTQKHQLLSQYKQGMMQKLFSQQIRFKADDGSEFGEWEDKKLGEISKTFSGGTPQSSNKSFYEGTIPFIKSGEISKNTTEQCINDLALEKSSAKLVKKGDLLYALYGATSGQVAISQIDGAINQAVLCIRSELNTKYLLNFLLLKKEEILTTYLQGGQGNLSASILKEIYIPTPCLEEQTKIANFLSAIDQKIEVVAHQIEQAKTWKKGLLQQMFV
ncbi:restriction endonuclease subunit S [Acinetobacter johnsonii]|uniref:restriction endonuclease subunit S n=1 Tax=Acinetobacter johnsonii TaxID=40214 RepID=UPI0018A00932|nr:restriction endonuclease subunit S [Acinetobacter johnsonii]QPF35217.1 restriction endonuclease subunit S [Acinetobacter johnsonii]